MQRPDRDPGNDAGPAPVAPDLAYGGPVCLRGECAGEAFAFAGTILLTTEGNDAKVRLIAPDQRPDDAPWCLLRGAVAPLVDLIRRSAPLGVGVAVTLLASACERHPVLPWMWPW